MITDNTNSNRGLDILKNMKFDRQHNVAENLFISIRELIQCGELPVGFVFPNEKELCALLDISRSTLREAYSKLSALNYIKRSKSGTSVTDTRTKLNALPFDILVEQSDMRDLMELRLLLEEEIAAKAAQNVTQEGIDELQMCIDKMKDNIDNLSALCIYDARFHTTLTKISENKLWQSILKVIHNYFEASILLAFEKDKTIMYRAIIYHERILNAVKNRDSEAARLCMHEHIQNVSNVYFSE